MRRGRRLFAPPCRRAPLPDAGLCRSLTPDGTKAPLRPAKISSVTLTFPCTSKAHPSLRENPTPQGNMGLFHKGRAHAKVPRLFPRDSPPRKTKGLSLRPAALLPGIPKQAGRIPLTARRLTGPDTKKPASRACTGRNRRAGGFHEERLIRALLPKARACRRPAARSAARAGGRLPGRYAPQSPDARPRPHRRLRQAPDVSPRRTPGSAARP